MGTSYAVTEDGDLLFDPVTHNVLYVLGEGSGLRVKVYDKTGTLLYNTLNLWAFAVVGGINVAPVEVGHNTFIFVNTAGTAIYRFRLDTGAYIDYKTVADLGPDSSYVQGIARQKPDSGKSFISLFYGDTLYLMRYTGGGFAIVGSTTGCGHGLSARGMTQNPGVKIWTISYIGTIPGTKYLFSATWANTPVIDDFDISTIHGVSELLYVHYFAADNSLIIVTPDEIIKVDADDPTILLDTLTLATAGDTGWHVSSQLGIQADNKFCVTLWQLSPPLYTYYIIDATTLTVVAIHDSSQFTGFSLLGFAPEVTWMYPEEVMFAHDITSTNNYFLHPGPDPGGDLDCFKIRTVDFEVPAATGTQFITASDLEGVLPKAALICLSGVSAEDTNTADIRVGIGAADTSAQWAFATIAKDGVTTINTKRFAQSDACALLCSDTAITHKAAFVNFVPNGIEINWSMVAAGAGFVILFTGQSLSAKVGTIIEPERDPGDDIDVGFGPDLVYVATNFLKFAASDDRFGISQGWFSPSQDDFQSADSPYAGKDGESTLLGTDAGAINRKHFTYSSVGQVATDALSGDLAASQRGGLLLESVVDGFKATAMNGLSALKDYGYLALSFGKRARITRVRWDMSAQGDGSHIEYHNNGEMEVIEALILMPAPSAHLGETANLGLGCIAGPGQNAVMARGSATLADGVYGKTVFSSGTFYIPTALQASGGVLQMAFQNFTEGEDGWEYILAGAPEADRAFVAIVIGRLEDCFPLAWHQAQLMENS